MLVQRETILVVTRITKLRKNREMNYLLSSNAKLAFGTSC